MYLRLCIVSNSSDKREYSRWGVTKAYKRSDGSLRNITKKGGHFEIIGQRYGSIFLAANNLVVLLLNKLPKSFKPTLWKPMYAIGTKHLGRNFTKILNRGPNETTKRQEEK